MVLMWRVKLASVAHAAAGAPVGRGLAPAHACRPGPRRALPATGGWALDPDAAVLCRSIHTPDASDHALAQISDALHVSHPPRAAIVAVGYPHATLSRYPDGISLLWRSRRASYARPPGRY
jgi:hypothetical protein